MEANSINQVWCSIKECPNKNWLLVLCDSTYQNWAFVASNDYIDYFNGKIKQVPVQNIANKKITPSDYSWWKRIG